MCTTPVVTLVVVTVTNVGPLTFSKVSGSPHGSEPVRVWSAVVPSVTVTLAGWFRTGAWFAVTVILKLLVSLKPHAVAVTEAG